jgi:hypothetical protein
MLLYPHGLRKDRNLAEIEMHEQHGMSGTKTYHTWQDMRYRCGRKAHRDYKYYGGRNITVCKRWNSSFANFFMDMGEKPDGLTIERINNDKGYTPDNCKSATRAEQSQNKRNYASGISCYRMQARDICKTKVAGVSPVKIGWSAHIGKNNKQWYLGYSKDFFEAVCLRKSAESKYQQIGESK